MANVEGPEFLGVVAGGSALNGEYLWVTLRLGNRDQTILIEKSRVGALLTGLMTAASMASADRKALMTDNPRGLETAFAIEVDGAGAGRSTDGESAIIEVLAKTELKAPMSVFLAAKPPALVALGQACAKALQMLKEKAPVTRVN